MKARESGPSSQNAENFLFAQTNIQDSGFWTCATGGFAYFSAVRNGQRKEQEKETVKKINYKSCDACLLQARMINLNSRR